MDFTFEFQPTSNECVKLLAFRDPADPSDDVRHPIFMETPLFEFLIGSWTPKEQKEHFDNDFQVVRIANGGVDDLLGHLAEFIREGEINDTEFLKKLYAAKSSVAPEDEEEVEEDCTEALEFLYSMEDWFVNECFHGVVISRETFGGTVTSADV